MRHMPIRGGGEGFLLKISILEAYVQGRSDQTNYFVRLSV